MYYPRTSVVNDDTNKVYHETKEKGNRTQTFNHDLRDNTETRLMNQKRNRQRPSGYQREGGTEGN